MRFKDQNGQQGVELFLGQLHGHMEFLKQQHLMFLNKVVPGKYRLRLARVRGRLSVSGITASQDSLNFESSEAILENPYLLLEIFDQSVRFGLPLSIEARRLVQEFLHLVDEEFRRSPRVIQSLQRILLSPSQPLDVLDEMLNTGVLVALIPEMKGVVNLIQYDEYHVYPVDKHLLQAVRILKDFGKPELPSQDSFYGQLFKELERVLEPRFTRMYLPKPSSVSVGGDRSTWTSTVRSLVPSASLASARSCS